MCLLFIYDDKTVRQLIQLNELKAKIRIGFPFYHGKV
jgi:hypothetical protein